MGGTLQFIVLFLITNYICFLGGYLVNFKQQKNPLREFHYYQFNLKKFIIRFYNRNSSDFLRINFEFSILLLGLMLSGSNGKFGTYLLISLLILGFVIYTYNTTLIFIFKRLPIIQSDMKFLGVGLMMVKQYKWLIIAGLFVILLVLGYIFSILSTLLLSQAVSQDVLLVMLVFVLTGGVYKMRIGSYDYMHQRTIFSPLYHLFCNFFKSFQIKKSFLFTKEEVDSKNKFTDRILNKKANVTVIALESIGEIIFTDKTIYQSLKSIFAEQEWLIKSQGVHIASILSNAPLQTGGSWLSVTTLLNGIKIDNELALDYLFKTNKSFDIYESLPKFFKRNGYYLANIAGIGGYRDDLIDWEKLKKIFPADSFVTFDNLDYKGKKMDFMGVSYCAPDQYMIAKGHEIVAQRSKGKPMLTLVSTLNSHYNWHSPIEVDENWQALNFKDFPTTKKTLNPDISNYVSAAKYQIEMLFDFIRKNSENTFVLFGDHQPPYVSDDSNSFSTPLYVLSKDVELIDGLRKVGFSDKIDLRNHEYKISHEVFYHIFMTALLG